jgi:phage-related minor tail protein
MKVINIRNSVTIIATLVAVLFIIASDLLQIYSALILSIEVILLPGIYIVGNTYIEEAIRNEYNKTIANMQKELKEKSEKIEGANVPKEKDVQDYDSLLKAIIADRGKK